MTDENGNLRTVKCYVKWYNPIKGYGFVGSETEGPDILLHANILKRTGRSDIAEGVRFDAAVIETNGRLQVQSIIAFHEDADRKLMRLANFASLDPETLSALPFRPARVKWYDQQKGIGFANPFGFSDDVFLHGSVLKAAGIATFETGEAIAIRTIKTGRGYLAIEISDWNVNGYERTSVIQRGAAVYVKPEMK